MVSHQRLIDLLSYDPETGFFRWRETQRGRTAGSIAGCDDNGYIAIYIDNKKYRAHRLALFYVYGVWPKVVDHKNRVKSDTRLQNLRSCTQKQNSENQGLSPKNTSGVRGVTWNKKEKRWAAQIKHHGRLHHLGWYKDFKEAVEVRVRKEKELFTFSEVSA